MENNFKHFNVNNYRYLLSENEPNNIYKSLDVQRKSLAQLHEVSCNSLNNNDVCDLLEHKLQKYTDTVYKDNNNVYNELLHQTFPNLAAERRLAVTDNLPHMNIKSHFKKLECSNNLETFCDQSESIRSCELEEFHNFFKKCNKNISERDSDSSSTATKKDSSLENRFKNLDKLQNRTGSYESNRHPINLNLDAFHTARDELKNQMLNKGRSTSTSTNYTEDAYTGIQKRQLGTRRTVTSKFVSPLLTRTKSSDDIEEVNQKEPVDERLKNIEPKMIELIMSEIMDQNPDIDWNDIAGLKFAKATIREAVVWPMLRPDIFTGLRKPPKGILLFGPPGTGKTLIGKCVASQSKSTFFSISASSLMSKWIGESEKMVRALFAVARVNQPSVIFIDEVDSLLNQRTEGEHESTRRIKTEFLVQLDGATIKSEDRVLVIGATNRPQELDEAARRRFVKRLYIPLPEFEGRLELVKKLMCNERHSIKEEDFVKIAELSEGYSGADIKNLSSEAALEPLRVMDLSVMEKIEACELRPLMFEDFSKSLNSVKPSVSPADLIEYIKWDKTYGSRSS